MATNLPFASAISAPPSLRGRRSTGCIISSSISNVVHAHTARLALRIHARRISKLAASPQKRISRRIIAENRFSPHKRPNSTFARFAAFSAIRSSFVGITEAFIFVLPDYRWGKTAFKIVTRSNVPTSEIVVELATPGFIYVKRH